MPGAAFNEDALRVQHLLHMMNYEINSYSGEFDVKTRPAIRDFRRDYKNKFGRDVANSVDWRDPGEVLQVTLSEALRDPKISEQAEEFMSKPVVGPDGKPLTESFNNAARGNEKAPVMDAERKNETRKRDTDISVKSDGDYDVRTRERRRWEEGDGTKHRSSSRTRVSEDKIEHRETHRERSDGYSKSSSSKTSTDEIERRQTTRETREDGSRVTTRKEVDVDRKRGISGEFNKKSRGPDGERREVGVEVNRRDVEGTVGVGGHKVEVEFDKPEILEKADDTIKQIPGLNKLGF